MYIYICTKTKTMDTLKKEYLLNCGGQTFAQCHVHKVPLVVSCPMATILCAYCHKQAYYACPKDTCDAGLCKDHHNTLPRTENNNVYHISPSTIVKDNVGYGNALDENSDDDSDTMPNDFKEDTMYNDLWEWNEDEQFNDPQAYTQFYNFFEEDLVDSETVYSVHSAVDEQVVLNDSFVVHEGLVTHNVFETDHLEADEPLCEDGEEMPSFLMTNSRKDLETICFGRHLIGSHVIFNKHG